MAWWRSATNASWSSARARTCAWTSPRRHTRALQPAGEGGERAVAGAVVAGVGPLQLHVEALRAERIAAAGGPSARARTVAEHRSPRAAGQADEPLGVLEDALQVDRRLTPLAPVRGVTGVGMGERDDPAEVAPAALVAHQQREVPGLAVAAPPGLCDHIDLGAVDRPDAVFGCRSARAPSSRRRSCGRSARAPCGPARPRAGPAPSGSETPSRNE